MTQDLSEAEAAWRKDAGCLGAPNHLFFPTGDRRSLDWSKPRAICNNCTVKEECLNDALLAEQGVGQTTRIGLGMRGGLSPAERIVLMSTKGMPPKGELAFCAIETCERPFIRAGRASSKKYCSVPHQRLAMKRRQNAKIRISAA